MKRNNAELAAIQKDLRTCKEVMAMLNTIDRKRPYLGKVKQVMQSFIVRLENRCLTSSLFGVAELAVDAEEAEVDG